MSSTSGEADPDTTSITHPSTNFSADGSSSDWMAQNPPSSTVEALSLIAKQDEIAQTFASMATRLSEIAVERGAKKQEDASDSPSGSSKSPNNRKHADQCKAVLSTLARQQTEYSEKLKQIVQEIDRQMQDKEVEQERLRTKLADLRRALKLKKKQAAFKEAGPPISELVFNNTVIDVSKLTDDSELDLPEHVQLLL